MTDWGAILAANKTQALEALRHNRALVARFPDIAKRLAEAPYCGDIATWSGYIPGALNPEDVHGRVALNTSAVRAQLLELLTEAAQRADHERSTP